MNTSVKNDDMLNQLILQHQNNYKTAIVEIIKNNTNSLINEDIISIIKEPPLASMDAIKQKLISLAKREGLVLNNEKLTKLLSKYRNNLIENINELKEIRNNDLIQIVNDFTPDRETDIICIDSKDFENIDKNIKKTIKKSILQSNKDILFKDIDSIYKQCESEEIKKKIDTDFEKYIKSTYQKQLLDNISIKMMVKNRTLISRVNEQGEHFLFTKSNSHIFKDNNLSTNK